MEISESGTRALVAMDVILFVLAPPGYRILWCQLSAAMITAAALIFFLGRFPMS